MATSLKKVEILTKKFQIHHLHPKRLSYGVKIAKIARSLCFASDTKLVTMATSLEELDLTNKIYPNTFHLVKRS